MGVARGAVLTATIMFLLPGAAATGFATIDADAWNNGTFMNTTIDGDDLELLGGDTTGTYTSRVFDAGDAYQWQTLQTQSSLSGADATVTVAVSNDSFASTAGQDTYGLSGGSESVNISVPRTRYIRFNYSLSRSGTEEIEIFDTNVTVADTSAFFIRDRSCFGDEEELFSISDRKNAHAAEPGLYGHHVCANNAGRTDFSQFCTRAESRTLSVYNGSATFSHLSTDGDMWNDTVCTGELTIGVRDTCPETTRAIASIYSLPADHVAKPGYYENQLCGAFFTDATLLMDFSLGPDDTVVRNGEEDPDEGLEQYPDGRDRAAITADNGSMVSGIVSGEGTNTTSVGYEQNGDEQGFNVTQSRTWGISYFVPFTRGDAETVSDRQSMIARGDFLDTVNPNFGLRFISRNLVRVTLDLAQVDLVTDMTLASGAHRLIINNIGPGADGRVRVGVNTTGSN